MRCVVLCAGFATRLRPLTLDRPKHLLPVAGRPMLDHLLDRLAASGIASGVLITNHRFISDFETWARERPHRLRLELIDDRTETNESRLGSIGDLHFALEHADVREDFIVVNGDNLFTFSLDPLLRAFRERGNTIALYDVGSLDVARRMGQATLAPDGHVSEFVEKPAHPAGTLASIGIYAYQQPVRALVARYLAERHAADRTGDFVAWLHRQVDVFAHVIPPEAGVWFDIGSLDQYQEANRAFGGEAVELRGEPREP